MQHVLVKSSVVYSVAYNHKKNILQVALKNGKIYEFEQVPIIFWQEMMLASSIGKYFYNNIKDSFPFEVGKWK